MAAVIDGRAPRRRLVQDDDEIADPRAIRVSLAPGSAAVDLPAMIVAPADAPGTILVDGLPRQAALTLLDAERAILVLAGDPAVPAVPADRTMITLLSVPGSGPADRGVVRREVVVDGWRVEVDIEPAARAALRDRARRGRDVIGESGPTEVRAIIPGVVVSVAVAAGDTVSAGQQLLVIEAMKMQNELRAPRDGTVDRVVVSVGETVEIGDLLLVIR
jgi:biotin carboxyl carrier protein